VSVSSTQGVSRAQCAAGIVLALLANYLLTNAGRIDIIDGQVRYEVAANWLERGEPTIRDRALAGTSFAIPIERATYGTYNAGASVSAMPLMLLSRLLPGHTVERDRFAFSMTGPVFGAAVAGVLVIAYGMLGLGAAAALWWAGITSLATLWWPASVTVFDQNQHAFFLLTGLLLAWQSGRRGNARLAALAGLTGGVLFIYQEIYVVLLPLLGLAVFASPGGATRAVSAWRGRSVDRAALLRYIVFGAGCSVGLLAFVAFNLWRFGTPVAPSRYDNPLMFSGNPVAGLLSLTVSPGKSILLFSPPVILGIIGARGLFKRAPVLVAAVGLISLIHVLLVIQLPFFGGDWCWGPRYLLVLLPLWALAFPFATQVLGRRVVGIIVTLGFIVQLMGISIDHQRFFLERDFPPYFWLDPWVYFKHSQLLARPQELLTLARDGVPAEATRFSPTPQAQITYTPAGPPKDRRPSEWARQFGVFYMLRPWPVWIHRLDPARRPIAPWPLLWACGALFAGGLALMTLGQRRASLLLTGGAPPDVLPTPGR
jgi:hypothetical protein